MFDHTQILNQLSQREIMISTGDISQVINFAKEYDIFQTSSSDYYNNIVDKIKTRLAKESISLDQVKKS
jgi:hypothetical protein